MPCPPLFVGWGTGFCLARVLMTQTVRFLLTSLIVASTAWAIAWPDTGWARVEQDAPSTVQFARSAAVVVESAQRATIAVTVSAPLSKNANVAVSVRGGTATIGEDVTLDADPVSITFVADDTQSQFVAFTLNADDQREGIEFIDLELQSDDVRVGAVHSFRLWIRDDVLYPEQIAGALTAQLQSDFEPSTILRADAAADSLLGVIWNEAGAVSGTFTRATATISGEGRPADLAGKQGLIAGHVWPTGRSPEAREQRDLHLLIPMHEKTLERHHAALDRATDESSSAAMFSDLSPRDELRGDLARAILYYHTMYPEQARADVLASLRSTLAQWMEEDPVDDRELHRSTVIARHQGQPNPFVIAPELAEPAFNLWGTYPTPTVSFAQSRASVAESDSVAVLDVTVAGVGDDEVTLTVALDAAASTVDAEDLDGFRYRTVRFPAGAPDGTVHRVRVPIVHDAVDEDTERAVFALKGASGFTRTGDVAQYALDIENTRQPTDKGEGRIVLGPAYPNPLSPGRGSTVQLEVSMEEALPFTVEVFSTLGQRVRAQRYSAGEAAQLNTIEIDAQDLPSGLYIVRLQGPSVNITETFVIVR